MRIQMKLYEVMIKEIPNLPTRVGKTKGHINATHKNWKMLGGGIQSDVYHHAPTDKAIKFISIDGSNDPSYQFLRLALKHQDNPYFPKIYSIKHYKSGGENLIVTMERLQPMTDKDRKRYVTLVGTRPKSGETPLELRQRVRDLWVDPRYRQRIYKKAADPALKQALRLLEPLFRHYHPDMHFHNVMVRSGNQFVFIDPVRFKYP